MHFSLLVLYRCIVLNITGFSSPHKDDVIDTNDRCDPATSSYVEYADCGGAVLEEQPGKTAESIRLFLQGLGHSTLIKTNLLLSNSSFLLVSHMSIPKFSIANRLTEQAVEYKRRNGQVLTILVVVVHHLIPSIPDSIVLLLEEDDLNDYGNELQLRVDSFDDRNVKL